MVSKRLFCCWSISFLAIMVKSGNDELSTLEPNKTLRSEENRSIKSATMLPVVTLVNTENSQCALLMNDSGVTEIIQLIQRNLVNIVDLRLPFSTSFNKRFFADKQIAIVKPIGEQILYTLDIERYNYATWSLNIGRESYKLNVREDPKECMGEPYDFLVSNIFQRIVLKIEAKPTNNKICYLQRTIPARHVCCHITKPDFTNLEYKCREVESQYDYLYTIVWILAIVTTAALPIIFLVFLHAILSHISFDVKYPGYHKLEKSTMSLSSILLNAFWGEYGVIISYARKLGFIGTLSGLSYVIYGRYTNTMDIVVLLVIITANIIISVAVFLMLKNINTKEYPLIKTLENEGFVGGVSFFNQLAFDIESLQKYEILNVKDEIKFLFTIPSVLIRRTSMKNLKMVALNMCYLLKVVLLLPLALLFAILTLSIIYFYVVFLKTPYIIMLILEFSYRRDRYSHPSHCRMLLAFCTMVILTFTFYTYYILVFATQSFLLGLSLNIVYFAPYAAILAVTAFYSRTYWKSLEGKCCHLKWLIYEECQQKEMNNNYNQRLKRNEKLLSVVNKELFKNIRLKLLPYGKELFWLILKFLTLLLYLSIAFAVVHMCHEYNVEVQIVTSVTVSVLPYVVDMLALKSGLGKGKETWGKAMELNLKRMVHDETENRPGLAQTYLVVEVGSAGTMRDIVNGVGVLLIQEERNDVIDDTVDATVGDDTSAATPLISDMTRIELPQIPPNETDAHIQDATNANTSSIYIQYETSA